MNRQIRLLGAGLMALFIALFVQLNYLQIVHAGSLNANPLNGERVVKEYSAQRGSIISADGVTLADSVPTKDQFKYQRQYPTGPLFEQVTGYFSFNYGSDGAESHYNDCLIGKAGKGCPTSLPTSFSGVKSLFSNTNPAQSLTLTVLDKVQTVAQTELAGRQGSVVALDPSTGAILAMYSNPSFDPNLLATHNLTKAVANYKAISATPGAFDPPAYRQTWFPGSSFKVITSAAVYDHNPALINQVQPNLSALPLPQTTTELHNFGGESCGGDLLALFTRSCDTGFGQLGLTLGAQNLYDEATSFGFNAAPPIDLPYGTKSNFPAVSTFDQNKPFLAYAAIGQVDVQASPLEMALVAGGIANGGVIMAPHILDHVTNSQGQTVDTYNPSKWMTATSPQTASSMTTLMEAVVNSPGGTGTAAAIPGVTVAGKTGTAQTGTGLTDDWFVAFAPAQNPQIAVAVVLPNQPGANDYQGGTIAAPVAKAVIQAYLATKTNTVNPNG
jgi:peptidoglycan glycosyltransferase